MALRFDRIEITGTSTSESTPSITNSSNELIRFQTTSGYVDIGANNTGYTHFYTDRNKFYFNKKLIVDEGMISAYNEDLTLAVNDGANTAITIDKDSPYNVGIGTTDPNYMLHLGGSTVGAVNGQLAFGDVANVPSGLIQGYRVDGSYKGELRFLTSTSAGTVTQRMVIDEDGYVGIGATSPAYLLDVNEDDNVLAFRVTGGGGGAPMASFVRDVGATGSQVNINAQSNFPQIQFINTGNTFSIGVDGANFKISDNTSIGTNDRITIDNTGNVGIGTTDPGAKLQINNASTVGTASSALSGLNPILYLDAGQAASRSIVLKNHNSGDNTVVGALRFAASPDGTNYSHAAIEAKQDANAAVDTLEFRTSSSNTQGATNNLAMIIQGGNVGISDTSPSHRLSVSGNVKLRYDTSAGGESVLFQNNTSGGAIQLGFQQNDSDGLHHRAYIVADKDSAGSIGGKLSFRTRAVGGGTTEAMTLRSDGNVGIGTTSPNAKLDINDSSNDVTLTSTPNYAINTGGAINARHYKNINLETPQMEWSIGGSTDLDWKKLATIVINDANYSGFGAEVEITDFSGNYGNSIAQYGDVYKGGLSIYHRAETGVEPKQGIITINNDIAPYIRIYKIPGSGNSSYQIQVKSPGNYRQIYVKLKGGIGNQVGSITPHANDTNGSTSGGTAYTPDTYTNGSQFKTAFPIVTANRGNILYRLGVVNTAPSYPLDVTGTIRATGDVIAYSDIRVKENIKTINNALDKVKSLRGVEYNKIDNPEKSIGVIAQEIEEVIPEVVREDDQGMKSVAYGNITAVLIEAIKEQQKQIDELKSIINGSSG